MQRRCCCLLGTTTDQFGRNRIEKRVISWLAVLVESPSFLERSRPQRPRKYTRQSLEGAHNCDREDWNSELLQ